MNVESIDKNADDNASTEEILEQNREDLKKGEEILSKFIQEQNKSENVAESPPEAETSTPPDENKEAVPSQFRTEEGKLDEKKLEKSTQHIEKSLKERRAALEKYKEDQ